VKKIPQCLNGDLLRDNPNSKLTSDEPGNRIDSITVHNRIKIYLMDKLQKLTPQHGKQLFTSLNEISSKTGISKPTVAKHLKIMAIEDHNEIPVRVRVRSSGIIYLDPPSEEAARISCGRCGEIILLYPGSTAECPECREIFFKCACGEIYCVTDHLEFACACGKTYRRSSADVGWGSILGQAVIKGAVWASIGALSCAVVAKVSGKDVKSWAAAGGLAGFTAGAIEGGIKAYEDQRTCPSYELT
jgi:hypothetical protein